MNYLKKYRKEAGLLSNNENMRTDLAAPTRETLDYLAGAARKSKASTSLAMKTPVRRNQSPPTKKTLSAAIDAGRKSAGNRQSGVKPFTRIDTNLHQSSSRKSFKQASSQSKKQQQEF